MTIPFTAIQFSVYERLKKMLNPSGSYSPGTHVIAGGLAGAGFDVLLIGTNPGVGAAYTIKA